MCYNRYLSINFFFSSYIRTYSNVPEFRDSITICIYRFVKEFTKGVESDWTVNLVNHIKPADIMEERV